MSRHSHHNRPSQGPTQRQLRAGELVRHALVEILREEDIADPDLEGVSVTVSEVRVSPDLRHATVFVEPLGGGHAPEVVDALNRHSRFLRGRLGHAIELRFTPQLKFLHDESFDEAQRMNRLFDDPRVRRDLSSPFGGGPSTQGVDGEGASSAEDPLTGSAGAPPKGEQWKDDD